MLITSFIVFLTISIPRFLVALKIHSHTVNMKTTKNSSHQRGNNRVRTPQRILSSEYCYYFTCLAAPLGKVLITGQYIICSDLGLTWWEKLYFIEHFSKTISVILLIMWLYEKEIPIKAKKILKT